MEIQFLVFDRVEELELVGPWELVGLLAERKKCHPPKLVTLNAMTPVGEHGMRFVAEAHFAEAGHADVVFVPGGSGGRMAMEDRSVISYLQERGRNGQAILSVCTGSFLMQKAGLLNGRCATTQDWPSATSSTSTSSGSRTTGVTWITLYLLYCSIIELGITSYIVWTAWWWRIERAGESGADERLKRDTASSGI